MRFTTVVWLLGLAGGVRAVASIAAQPPGTPEPLAAAPLGQRVFSNSRDPPSWQTLDTAGAAQRSLGHAVFNTQWVAAGTPGAGRRDGLGPFFDAASCDECHNEGADARGPLGDGQAPSPLVVQVEQPARSGQSVRGDPRYGHILSVEALEAIAPEGAVTITYQPRRGHYADGTRWTLRVPTYHLDALRYGALSPSTIIKPRLAPPLFGDGLLEAVPETAISAAREVSAEGDLIPQTGLPAWQWIDGRRELGRFGWQGSSISIRDQTTKAFAREMGLTSRDMPQDDCTATQRDCRAQPNGGAPEVADDLLAAVVTFVRGLAVPAPSPLSYPTAAGETPNGSETFRQVGCADCHRPLLPVRLPAGQAAQPGVIAAYTDLRLHDLGEGLADRDASGRSVPSRWRTAPLWGMSYRLGREAHPTLLHDGRARSLEEAILWHDGEARLARERFEALPFNERRALLDWIAGSL